MGTTTTGIETSREREFTAGSVDEAVRHGLRRLGLDREQAAVTVLDKGSRGFLGIGARAARIRLVPKDDLEAAVHELAAGLLERMGVEARVTVTRDGTDVTVRLESGEVDGLLIGRKGETLEALQHILLRMAGRKLDGRIRSVRVDVAGYRERREAQLRTQVQGLAEKVERTGRRAMTEPLTPVERRLVHRILAERAGVETHAGGRDGVNQRVIITPSRRGAR